MPNRPACLILVLALWPAASAADESFDPTPFALHSEDSSEHIDHGAWGGILERYSSLDDSGLSRFDYGRVTEEDRRLLAAYVDSLQARDPRRYNRDEQMAYWINLYNAVTVKVVLDHFPVASIRDIALPPAAAGGGPWQAPLVRVLGQRLSLDQIENQILRPLWRDPRVHFAINCASVGCPNLETEPWTGEGLDGRLDRAARRFVGHPRGVRFDGDRLTISSLFLWFREDFGGSDAAVLDYLGSHAGTDLAAALADHSGELAGDYDWSLNRPIDPAAR